jgi:hypothetical protein
MVGGRLGGRLMPWQDVSWQRRRWPAGFLADFSAAVQRTIRDKAAAAAQVLVDTAVPPVVFGHRHVRHRDAADAATARRVIHHRMRAENPRPANVSARDALPGDPGWWGFSFRDVPDRLSGPTALLSFENVDVVSAREVDGRRDWFVGLLDDAGNSLNLREIRYQPLLAEAARRSPRRIRQGIWIAERVYHNHSHWLTAHLPKLALLREIGGLDDLVLPAERSPLADQTLREIGVSPEACVQARTGERLSFQRLDLLETDRFRPELVQLAVSRYARFSDRPRRRIFISRRGARGRCLLEEERLEPDLRARGFEVVRMEALTFEEQRELMGQTEILAAPHGAGLTNMMFCPPGAHIVEIADPSYPNPNFYALACALDHVYWYVPGRGIGFGPHLDRDLSVSPAAIVNVLDTVIDESGGKGRPQVSSGTPDRQVSAALER